MLAWLFSPFFAMYFGIVKPTAVLCWAWIGLFTWFVFSKSAFDTRGIGLIVGSVFLAIGGEMYLEDQEAPQIVEALKQVFLLIGGSVGGSFLAHAMLEQEKGKTKNSTNEGQT